MLAFNRLGSKLQGWLLVFVAQCMVGLIVALYLADRDLLRSFAYLRSSIPLGLAAGPLVAARCVGELLIAIVLFGGLKLTAQLHRSTSRYWQIALPLIGATIFAVLWTRYRQAELLVAAGRRPTVPARQLLALAIINVMMTVAWLLYWMWSHRVRMAFSASPAPTASTTDRGPAA